MYFLFQVSLLTYFVNLNWTLQGHLDGPDDCFMLTSEGIVMNFKFVMWNQQLQSKLYILNTIFKLHVINDELVTVSSLFSTD